MLVFFCSTTGAPGVSAWSVLVAGLLASQREVVVVEADAAGGVMATRYGIGVTPGSAELAVSCATDTELAPRTDGVAADLAGCGRRVGERAWMVPAPVIPAEANAVWSDRNAELVASTLAADNRTWIVDGGRFGSAAWTWHEAASQTVVLVPGWTDALVCAQPVVSELAATGSTRVFVVGKTDYGTDELAGFFGLDVGVLPRPDVVDESASVWSGSGRFRRGGVWSAASQLAADLDEAVSLVGGPA